MKEITVGDIYKDLKRAHRANKQLFDAIKKDFEFALGKQWDKKDAEELRKAGRLPLTINKLKPLIKLITGIERQSRSDFKAFPEGVEDELVSDIVTRLLKNVMKRGRGDRKLSDQFKHGIIGGVSFIEPYIDYTYDLLNGEMKFRKISARNIYYDPSSEEYDLSDSRYFIKVTKDLSKDDLLAIFPGKEEQINKIEHRKMDFSDDKDGDIQFRGYKDHEKTDGQEDSEDGYDLIDYYYKRMVNRYFVADQVLGRLKETDSKEEADLFIKQHPGAVVINKNIPEIRICQVVGRTKISDDVAWSFPRWKGYPFLPYFCERVDEDLEDRDLLVQGIVRGLIDLQLEYNKRRSQELAHLNSSQNSGTLAPKGAIDKRTQVRMQKLGSSPGFFGEYDPEKAAGTTPESWKIRPTPLSQGHAQLAQETAQDLKEGSGVNPDLLANDSESQSGRAILLKQRQGLVMVQEALDNYSDTKKLLGKFILSQLGEIYTVETAIRVVGDKFIAEQEAFKSPAHEIIAKATQKAQQGIALTPQEQELVKRYPSASTENPAVDERNNLVLVTDPDIVGAVFNQILNDSELGKYDVSIGEGVYNETIRISNYTAILDMAKSGVPIPPDIIVENSLLAPEDKEKIKQSIEAQQQAVALQQTNPIEQGAF